MNINVLNVAHRLKMVDTCCFPFVSACMVGKNLKNPNLSHMGDDAIMGVGGGWWWWGRGVYKVWDFPCISAVWAVKAILHDNNLSTHFIYTHYLLHIDIISESECSGNISLIYPALTYSPKRNQPQPIDLLTFCFLFQKEIKSDSYPIIMERYTIYSYKIFD